MSERVRYHVHKGRQVIVIDFSHLDIPAVHKVIEAAAPVIRSLPEKSVRTLTIVEGTTFDSSVIHAMKQFAKGNEPHVKAAAVVGLRGLQRLVLNAVVAFTRRNFIVCDTPEEALDRLVAVN